MDLNDLLDNLERGGRIPDWLADGARKGAPTQLINLLDGLREAGLDLVLAGHMLGLREAMCVMRDAFCKDLGISSRRSAAYVRIALMLADRSMGNPPRYTIEDANRILDDAFAPKPQPVVRKPMTDGNFITYSLN